MEVGSQRGDMGQKIHIATINHLLELRFRQLLGNRIVVLGLGLRVAWSRGGKVNFQPISGQKKGCKRPPPKERAGSMRPIPPSRMDSSGKSIPSSVQASPGVFSVGRGAVAAIKPVGVSFHTPGASFGPLITALLRVPDYGGERRQVESAWSILAK